MRLLFNLSALFIGALLLESGFCWEGAIVFEDNFDGSSLDLNKWEYQEGCGNGPVLLILL